MCDIDNAFVRSFADSEIFVRIPKEFREENDDGMMHALMHACTAAEIVCTHAHTHTHTHKHTYSRLLPMVPRARQKRPNTESKADLMQGANET